MIKKIMIFLLLSFTLLQGNYCLAQHSNIIHEKTTQHKEKNTAHQPSKMNKKIGMIIVFFLLLCSLFFLYLRYSCWKLFR